MSSEQGQHQEWRKWWSKDSLHTSGDLQLTKHWPFPHLFGEVTMNISLCFVFVLMEGSRMQRPFVNFEVQGDSGFSFEVTQT